jgi:uncharacterized protein YggE
MNDKLILTVIAVLMVQTSIAEPELSGTPTELRRHLDTLPGQVTISGLAERTVEADRAVVQVSVLTSDRDLKPALELNSKIRAGIVTELTAAEVDTNRIHTSRFSSTPVHSSWTGKVKEYQIKSTVRVNAESEKEIQVIAGLVDSSDNVSLSSLTFEMTKRDEMTEELLKEAFQLVQKRKALYESSLGVQLRPRSVGIPKANDTDRRAEWLLRDYKAPMSVSSVLTNPELSVVLHALEQRGPEINQFEELLFKVGIVVTFDVLPEMDKGEPPTR